MPACHAGDRRFESGRVRHIASPYAPSARPDGAFSVRSMSVSGTPWALPANGRMRRRNGAFRVRLARPACKSEGVDRFRPTRSPVGTPGVPGALRTAQCRSPGHYAARASHPEQRDPAERARRTWIPSVRPRSGARVACSSRLVPSRRASSSQTASQGGYRPQARHQGGRASRSSCAGSRRGQPPRWRKRRTSGRSSVTGSTPAASTASQPRARRAAIVGASVVMTTQADGEAPASASASVGA